MVYLADQDVDGVIELYSVPVSGGTVYNLNPPLVTGGNVDSFKIAPNNLGVLFVADQETDEDDELFVVSIFGGAADKVSGPLGPGGDVSWGVEVTPDSRAVIYRADQEIDEKFELFITVEGQDTYLPMVVK